MPLRGNKGPVVHPHGLTQCFTYPALPLVYKTVNYAFRVLTISGRALTVMLLLCYVNCTVKSLVESVVQS